MAELVWTRVKEGMHHALAAALPQHRLEDFLAGEGKRGSTRVHLHVFRAATDGVTLNKRGSCFYGAPNKAHQKARQQMLPSDEAEPVLQGKRARKCALQRGTSCKLHCGYHFFAKAYAKLPDTVFIKFPCGAEDAMATCTSMRHTNADGTSAHPDVALHAVGHTDEMRAFVVDKLKAHTKPAVIRAGM